MHDYKTKDLRAVIIKQTYPKETPYNVQLWNRCSDGRWFYGGGGRFCDNLADAVQYADIHACETILEV